MLSITALDLDRWSDRHAARATLPVLVRKLLQATSTKLESIDFPADESVDAPGWDGCVVAEAPDSSWTPQGPSYWELSCRADVARKAKDDFDKRTKATPDAERAAATFVFVTPRRWRGKDRWAKAARDRGGWRDVRVYDAETLVQWLETAPGPRLWMQARLGRAVEDLSALEDFWELWADATRPVLAFDIFAEALEENRGALTRFFASRPDAPLLVAADTRSEAAAFAAGLLLFGAEAAAAPRCVVARTPAGLQELKSEARLPVVVVPDPQLEPLLGDLPTRTWVLIATDRSSPDMTPTVVVEPLTWEAFHRTSRAMGLSSETAGVLERESGRRITIIRRRLSSIPGVRRPLWADLPDLTPTLAGLALAGGWLWERPGDREVLCAITGVPEDRLEAAIRRLSMLEDAPIYVVGGAGGLISRHDAFPALRQAFTRGLMTRFFETCAAVFGAKDPSLELEPDQRWLANIYGKERPHTGRLRRQLSETLAFLSTAKVDFAEGFSAPQAAEALVSRLFAAGDDAWLQLRDVLPDLAEAAPRAFLAAACEGLPYEAEDRGLWRLLKPTEGHGMGESLRVNLIWALERLAENADDFARVADILAALTARPLKDNLVTKPLASLVGLLHPSGADSDAAMALRARTLSALARRRPEAAWSAALALIDDRLGYRPRSRSRRSTSVGASGDATETGDVRSVAFEIALGRGLSSREALELIEKSPCFDGAPLDRLWDRIATWQAAAPQPDRAAARQAVRKTALWRNRRKAKGFDVEPDPRAREIFDLLRAPGPAGQYSWLFQSAHVDIGSDELWDEALDWRARHERIEAERRKAIEVLWAHGELAAVAAFARDVGSPSTVGIILSQVLPNLDVIAVTDLVQGDAARDWPGRHDFLAGVLTGLGGEGRKRELRRLAEAWSDRPEARLEVLLLCPADSVSWDEVDQLPSPLRTAYWSRVTRRAWDGQPETVTRACRELLAVGRPRAALNQAGDAAEALDTGLLIDILLGVAQVAGPESDGGVDSHLVEHLLSTLDARPDANRNTRLRLDFIYAEALEHSARGLAALSQELAENPEVFALAIRSYYRRDDGTEEPIDEANAEAEQRAAALWMSVLENCRLPPGADAEGAVDPERLADWLARATTLLEADGRTERGLYRLGALLGRTRREVDGVWPPTAVAAVLEPYAGGAFRSGLEIGILNSRGVHSRAHLAGGQPERVLAEKYRGWRRRLQPDFPNLAQTFEEVALSYESHARRHDEDARFHRAAVR